jgi:hypothetical protein
MPVTLRTMNGQSESVQNTRTLWLLLIVPLILSLAALWTLDHAKAHKPIFSMTNMVGPEAQSLLEGRGLTVCTEDMGTRNNPICFHSARMPMTAWVVSLGMRLLGDRYLWVASFKTLLLLLPLALAIYLVWKNLPHSQNRKWLVVLLLLVPFAMTPFLADVTNMLVEEGYTYSFLALAVALLFFGWQPRPTKSGTNHPLLLLLAFAVSLDALYLSKSGMLPLVLVLVIGFLLTQQRTQLRLLVIILVAAAPIGWALYQHHASGRFNVGTSFDGINLHKGNNAGFLDHYPPARGNSMDWYDFELNRGLYFPNEWTFNDYHQQAALNYLLAHPRETLHADLRKLYVIFIAVEKYGGTASFGATRALEDAGLVLFRLMLWYAIAYAIYQLIRARQPHQKNLRTASAIFLAIVAAATLPFLAGFAYTRHISILIYPTALFCSRILCEPSHQRGMTR